MITELPQDWGKQILGRHKQSLSQSICTAKSENSEGGSSPFDKEIVVPTLSRQWKDNLKHSSEITRACDQHRSYEQGPRVGEENMVPSTYGGFPEDALVKNLPANAEDTKDRSSIPVAGRSPGGGNGNPLQYSCLGNPIDREWLQSMGSQRVRHD